MVDLTSFTLKYTSEGGSPVSHLLDIFKGAPRLRKIKLLSATPTFGAQIGRLMSLPCLKKMDISGGVASPLLLDHLLIPVGAKLATQAAGLGPPLDSYLPKSHGNLGNLSGFTKSHLAISDFYPHLRFTGPNGRVDMISSNILITNPRPVLQSLARFDTSKAERLRVVGSDPGDDAGYNVLLPMRNEEPTCPHHSPTQKHIRLHPRFVSDPIGTWERLHLPKVGETGTGRTC